MGENENRCTLFPRESDVSDSGPGLAKGNDTIPTPERLGDRCTLFPRHFEIGSTIGLIQDVGEIPQRVQQRLQPVKRLQIPLKRTIDSENQPHPKRPASIFCKGHTPWIKYQKFPKEGRPGKTCLAYSTDSLGTVVAMKEYKTSGIDQTCHLQMIDHPNIVNLMDAFEESRVLYLVYEIMEVSLEQLQAGIQLKESDLSFICREVLNGLWYIHRDLGVCHTTLTYDNIFISSKGDVKIANIANCLLERHKGSEQLDIRCVGTIVSKILQPGVSHDTQACLTHGSDHIRSFVSDTESATIQALMQHVFISYAAPYGCLVVPVMKVRGLVMHDYE
ncbi:hypothetical protein N7493_000957 [Penicillium malachiteum]|uniref:Protein kinase domain-containing protein n=1 Tax=Penicillium malachiteum TaxID=1324776 RepID=A0AAD6N1W7_9EURO|nr:hypothetical protein N7493_000957 [Penicillium malachiteum]